MSSFCVAVVELNQEAKVTATVKQMMTVFALTIAMYDTNFDGAFALAISGITVSVLLFRLS